MKILPPYTPTPCPHGCLGGVRLVAVAVTPLGYWIACLDTHHNYRTYGQIAGRGWTLDEARADGRARLAEWLARQRHVVEVAA